MDQSTISLIESLPKLSGQNLLRVPRNGNHLQGRAFQLVGVAEISFVVPLVIAASAAAAAAGDLLWLYCH